MPTSKHKASPRSTYRHGDLYRTLLTCALELARSNGKDAVTLREVTRQAGVVPNAAYRHFANRHALLQAVGRAAQAELANCIDSEIANVKDAEDNKQHALAKFRAVGVGYIKYAKTESNLFRMAFSIHEDLSNKDNPESTGKGGLTPFQLLGKALDDLVSVGYLPNEHRANTELIVWSAVHGYSLLLIDGPLRALNDMQTNKITQQLIAMIERGIE
jgi:AcrR family transcriptional regulator